MADFEHTQGGSQGFPMTRLSYSQVIHRVAVVVPASGLRIKIHPVSLKKKVTFGVGKKFQSFQIKS
jgi:hypothetical protein